VSFAMAAAPQPSLHSAAATQEQATPSTPPTPLLDVGLGEASAVVDAARIDDAGSAGASPRRTRSVPFPMQALLDRMGPHLHSSTWGRFMPPTLLERQRQCTIVDWVAASSSGDSEDSLGASSGSHGQLVLDRDVVGKVVAGRVPSNSSYASTALSDGVDRGLLQGIFCIKGHVWLLAQDPKGCRAVQEAFEHAVSEEAHAELTLELHGHVAKAFRCPYANHVLQRCIVTASRPEIAQFVVNELLEREGLVGQAARHRYGCRIVQQLLKKCTQSQVLPIADQLLEDGLAFSCHPFANFVMQQLLEHGPSVHRQRLTSVLERNISIACRSSPGCNVVGAALRHGSPDDGVRIAHAILQDSGRLRLLTNTRAGNVIIELISQVVDLSKEEYAGETSMQEVQAVKL